MRRQNVEAVSRSCSAHLGLRELRERQRVRSASIKEVFL
jgi:hypothetical protein